MERSTSQYVLCHTSHAHRARAPPPSGHTIKTRQRTKKSITPTCSMGDFPFVVHSLGLLVHYPKVLVAVCRLDMIAQAFRSIRRSPLHGVPAADVLAVLSYQYATHDSFTYDCRLELHKVLPCPSRFGPLRCCYELHFDLFAVVLSDESFFMSWDTHPRCRRRLHTCDLYLTTIGRD